MLYFVAMASPREILKQYWGFEQFRPLQEDIVQSILAGRDTLALLPTGGGKSICFQVPALAQDGLCLVISPLIALMKDQVANLEKRGIKAAAIYTGQTYREMDRLLDNCVFGNYKFLYISPERLSSDAFRMRLAKMNIRMLAIDEAHCISQWGYDFRPSYLRIAEVREQLKVPVIALTATATPEVVEDIQQKLLFKNGQVFKKSFARKNLSYVVRPTINRLKSLVDILQKVNGTAIVYVRNRRRTKEIADALNKQRIKADYYHAGLPPDQRNRKQNEWMTNKTRVIVCTNAFGMGIDKPEVRVVAHMDVADSLEAYFQEAGRAGRDEQKAYAVQLLENADLAELDEKIKEGFPTVELVREVYDKLGGYLRIAYNDGVTDEGPKVYDFDIRDFCEKHKLNPVKTLVALKLLEQQEWLMLAEGIFEKSQVKVICTKDVLYKFQVENVRLEPLVKFILRTSEGVFDDYVTVEEDAIARRLKIPVDETVKQLNILDKQGIVAYRPRKDKPQLFWMKPRVSFDNLRLDNAFINRRKTAYEERLKTMRDYLTDNLHCRTRKLVKYFGEILDQDCGICDVCVERKNKAPNTSEMANIAELVESKLRTADLSTADLVNQTGQTKEVLWPVLEQLLNAGKIERTPEGKLTWKK